MSTLTLPQVKAELIKADTALRSFRDGGYSLADALGEVVDNSLQSGATKIRIAWKVKEQPAGRNKKTKRQFEWFAVADNGSGIAAEILANVLTVGFSTRYGSREGIGRFGVGFKLASISQAKHMEVYTRPAYLNATRKPREDGQDFWTFSQSNDEGRIFKTYLDLEEIDQGEQTYYTRDEVEDFPEEYAHLMGEGSGTLIVWRELDRLNHEPSFAERVDEKLKSLAYFLRRTYRVYIANGTEIYLDDDQTALVPYDPLFEIDDPDAVELAKGQPMKGERVESGTIDIDGHKVHWLVQLTPPITRMKRLGGGEEGPEGPSQFKKLHIPDNEGKISFLRHNREVSYTTVPRMFPTRNSELDRYIGIQVSFPPALDEYFQVKHIKRGAEPVEKLREELRKALNKPIKVARERIKELWDKTQQQTPPAPSDTSGDRKGPENLVKTADPGLPPGKAGLKMAPDEEERRLRQAATDVGITDIMKQDEFIKHAKQKPVVSLDVEWPGKGLLDIEHLTHTVVVRINRRHPFIQQVYLPLREVIAKGPEGIDSHEFLSILTRAADGMDLLLFAYAKAENASHNPEDDYGMLREDWGKFAAVYLRDLGKVAVS
jgi:hypothetical protein